MTHNMENIKVLRGYEIRTYEILFHHPDESPLVTRCCVDTTQADDDTGWADILYEIWMEYNANDFYDELTAYTDIDFDGYIIRLTWVYDVWNGIIETRKEEFKK